MKVKDPGITIGRNAWEVRHTIQFSTTKEKEQPLHGEREWKTLVYRLAACKNRQCSRTLPQAMCIPTNPDLKQLYDWPGATQYQG